MLEGGVSVREHAVEHVEHSSMCITYNRWKWSIGSVHLGTSGKIYVLAAYNVPSVTITRTACAVLCVVHACKMLDRTSSAITASWDPLSLDDPASSTFPDHPSVEMGADLDEPGELRDDQAYSSSYCQIRATSASGTGV
jgi:hypothetical protein